MDGRRSGEVHRSRSDYHRNFARSDSDAKENPLLEIFIFCIIIIIFLIRLAVTVICGYWARRECLFVVVVVVIVMRAVVFVVILLLFWLSGHKIMMVRSCYDNS